MTLCVAILWHDDLAAVALGATASAWKSGRRYGPISGRQDLHIVSCHDLLRVIVKKTLELYHRGRHDPPRWPAWPALGARQCMTAGASGLCAFQAANGHRGLLVPDRCGGV